MLFYIKKFLLLMWFYIKKFLLLLRFCLLLNKYFNFFNFLFIIWIKPFDFNLFNALVEDDSLNTPKEDNYDNYKWWLQKIIIVTMFVIGIYVVYKLASNGTNAADVGSIDSANVNTEDAKSEDLNEDYHRILTDEELNRDITSSSDAHAGPIISKHW